MENYNKYKSGLINQIRKLIITKQLNILIGSGCSVPSIPLMSYFNEYGSESNNLLIKRTMEVSKLLKQQAHDDNRLSDRVLWESISKTLKDYEEFFECIIDILNISNSRQVPKAVNIFTTNYDLFIEMAISNLLKYKRIVFNDGASGYFNRVLDSTNYNRVVSYKGLNDNYISEIPSVNLIKSHGSVNWSYSNESVIVHNKVIENPMIVKPNGLESQETFINNYFHDMLRIFQLELDKPQSVLLVIGFSFQDKHIAKMLLRALQNPELMVYIFSYSDNRKQYLKNLGIMRTTENLKIITPTDIFENDENSLEFQENKNFVLKNLTEVLSIQTKDDFN